MKDNQITYECIAANKVSSLISLCYDIGKDYLNINKVPESTPVSAVSCLESMIKEPDQQKKIKHRNEAISAVYKTINEKIAREVEIAKKILFI